MELKEETVRALSAAAQIALTDAEIIKYGRELAELERDIALYQQGGGMNLSDFMQ